jgi:hypothetical protein
MRNADLKSEEAEKIRKQYLYRRLIRSGKVRLSPEAARMLIGPDTAYHLYSQVKIKPEKK